MGPPSSATARFLFAIDSTKKPELFIDSEPAGPMQRARTASDYSGKLKTGRSHSFYYMIDASASAEKRRPGVRPIPTNNPASERQALAKNRAHEQDLRRHAEQLLDLRAAQYDRPGRRR